MTHPVLVTGGTGTIGSRVVPLLVQADHDVRVLSRKPGTDRPQIQYVAGNTVKGRGLTEALEGVSTVLHLAGGAKGDDVAAENLVEAARRARTEHLVLISVVGADRMPIGYFRAKARAEQTFERSGVPFSIVRVAQLHEFVLPVAKFLTRLPLALAPRGLRFEPVDVDAVAQRLTELTLGRPAGRVADLAGPEVLDMRQILGQYLAAQGRSRRLVGTGIPGGVGRAYRAGENLAGPGVLRAGRTWEAFLFLPGDDSSSVRPQFRRA
ncbi:NmrA family transcriptional regulator [Kineosporia sp. NBRC 101677]|uniref:SDR family oxidoreductase n=1 Tax=Kineosporia sp. NBRC 101677 TaxID=3032197 RepID=UPI0024A103F0|nr:NAD(P)H-binding protein [Kineosporia sp. NBRC 101677]GLY19603.1 NmrA family transcriptional regulator [Kineosporia sp. NBRC 101677]